MESKFISYETMGDDNTCIALQYYFIRFLLLFIQIELINY